MIGLCIPLGMAGSPLAPILMITIFLAITMYTGYFLWKTGYRLAGSRSPTCSSPAGFTS